MIPHYVAPEDRRMRYGTPKFYDCEECGHEDGEGCEVFRNGPPQTPCCPFFARRVTTADPVAEAEREEVSRAVRRRSSELYSSYAGGSSPLSELSLTDWQDMVQRLAEAVASADVRRTIRAIRDFGADGLVVACGSCGGDVEIDEDSRPSCPNCGRPLTVE